MLQCGGEFGECFSVGVDLIAQHRGRGGGRGEPDDGAAAVPPGGREGLQRGGFAAAGRRDRELQPGTRGCHLANQRRLSSVQDDAVGGGFQQRHIHRGAGRGVPVATLCGGDQPLLGVQDPP